MERTPIRRENDRNEKNDKSDKNENRINHYIRAREVRVIDDEGKQLGIFPIGLAIERANEKGFDLVEIVPNAEPPVCRIMDYGKYKYQQKKKQILAKKNQVVVVLKEIKFRPKIEAHDFNFKVRNMQRFLEEGNKVKATITFRGRELAHVDIGSELMKRIIAQFENTAVIESTPKLEGKNLFTVFASKPK